MHADGTGQQTDGRTDVMVTNMQTHQKKAKYILCPVHSFACHGMGKKFFNLYRTNGYVLGPIEPPVQ